MFVVLFSLLVFTPCHNFNILKMLGLPNREKCGHDRNRYKVCAPCGKKIVCGTKTLEFFSISLKYETLIKQHINDNFSLSDRKFPLSICNSCRRALYTQEKSDGKFTVPTMTNYEAIILPRETRNSVDVCNCYICLTSKFKCHVKPIKGRGKKRQICNKIIPENGLYGCSTVKSLPAATEKDNKAKEDAVNKYCATCFQKIGKLKPAFIDNITNIISQKLSETQRDQVVTKILRQKLKGTDESDDIEMSLSNSKGKKTKVIMNPSASKETVFDIEELDNYHVNTGTSMNGMKRLSNFIQSTADRKAVPSHAIKTLSDRSKALQDLYTGGFYEFDIEQSSVKHKRPVIWAHAEQLLEVVLTERQIIGNYTVKVMADKGKDFSKFQ